MELINVRPRPTVYGVGLQRFFQLVKVCIGMWEECTRRLSFEPHQMLSGEGLSRTP